MLDDIFRKYKKEGVTKGDVARLLVMDQGYLSKIIHGEKPLTEKNAELINEKYGHIAKVNATKALTISELNEKMNSMRREFDDFKIKVSEKIGISLDITHQYNQDEEGVRKTTDVPRQKAVFGGGKKVGAEKSARQDKLKGNDPEKSK